MAASPTLTPENSLQRAVIMTLGSVNFYPLKGIRILGFIIFLCPDETSKVFYFMNSKFEAHVSDCFAIIQKA